MHHRSVQTVSLFLFLGFGLFVLYLWGKVQIDFAVRKNAKLKQGCMALQHEIDDLQIDLNNLKSYQRITKLAQEQGLVFLPPDRIEDLPVDLSGLKPERSDESNDVVLAGISVFNIPSKKANPSRIFGGNDGTR